MSATFDEKRRNITAQMRPTVLQLSGDGTPVLSNVTGTFLYILSTTGTGSAANINIKAYQNNVLIATILNCDDFWRYDMPGTENNVPLFYDRLEIWTTSGAKATIALYVGSGNIQIPGALAVVDKINEVVKVDACYIPHDINNNENDGDGTNFSCNLLLPQNRLIKSIYATLTISSATSAGIIQSVSLVLDSNSVALDVLDPLQASFAYGTAGGTFGFALKNVDLFDPSAVCPYSVNVVTSTPVTYSLSTLTTSQITAE